MLPFHTPASASAQEAPGLVEYELTEASNIVLFAGLPASPEGAARVRGASASIEHGICCQIRLHSTSDQNSVQVNLGTAHRRSYPMATDWLEQLW